MRGKRKSPEGITVRHSRSCGTRHGGSCNCKPSYQAGIFSKTDGKKIRKTFPTLAEAKGWRADASTAVRRGTMRAAGGTTVREAAEAWLAGAGDGSVRNRSGDVYKPSMLRGYEQALRTRLLGPLGALKLSEVTRGDV